MKCECCHEHFDIDDIIRTDEGFDVCPICAKKPEDQRIHEYNQHVELLKLNHRFRMGDASAWEKIKTLLHTMEQEHSR